MERVEIAATNTYTYENGAVKTLTGPTGLISTNNVDALQRPLSLQYNINSSASTNTYNGFRLSSNFDVGGTNTYTYDAMGRVVVMFDAMGHTNGVSRCACGAVMSVTNAQGEETQFVHNYVGESVASVRNDGFTMQYKYDNVGRLTNYLDDSGLSITNYFNNQGALVVVSNIFGQVFSNKYDIRDRVVESIDANGVKVVTTYDNAGRIMTRTLPDGGSHSFGYSAKGLIAMTNELGNVTRYGYNAARWKIAETNANSEITQYGYTSAGELSILIDPKGQTNQWRYDAFGRVTNRINSAGVSVLQLAYDAQGRLTNRWTVAKGNTAYSYDANGNLTNINYPSSSDITFTYDEAGRVKRIVDEIGTTDFSYDEAGRLQTEDGPWPMDTIAYQYKTNGLRSRMTLQRPNASAWVQSYNYDGASRLTETTSPEGVFSYSYTQTGPATSPGALIKNVQFPNNAYITNTFDANRRLLTTTLKNSNGVILNSHDYVYDVANHRTKQTWLGGRYTDYAYDAVGRLRSAIAKESGGTTRMHENLGYAYDANGNLQYRTNNALVQSFAVNALNQLSNVTRSGTLTVAGVATATPASVTVNGASATIYADNAFAKSGVSLTNGANVFTAVAADASGRLATNSVSYFLPSTVTYTYDGNGNLTSDGRRTFTWTDENQLASVVVTNAAVASSTKVEMQYDAMRRRRSEKTYEYRSGWVLASEMRIIYDGNAVLQTRDGLNLPTSTITRGPDLSGGSDAGGIGGILCVSNTADGERFTHTDARGTITALLSPEQNAERMHVDPFGTIHMQPTGFAINGKPFSSVPGLSDFLHRYYDPNLQRWMSEDGAALSDFTLAKNLYEFCDNEPISVLDPLGDWVNRWDISIRNEREMSGSALVVDLTANISITFSHSIYDDALERKMLAYAKDTWNSSRLSWRTGYPTPTIFKLHVKFNDFTTANHDFDGRWNSIYTSNQNTTDGKGVVFGSVIASTDGRTQKIVPFSTMIIYNRMIDMFGPLTRPNKETPENVFAHEVGHLLGYRGHLNIDRSLMSDPNKINGTSLFGSDLQHLLTRNADGYLWPWISKEINNYYYYRRWQPWTSSYEPEFIPF